MTSVRVGTDALYDVLLEGIATREKSLSEARANLKNTQVSLDNKQVMRDRWAAHVADLEKGLDDLRQELNLRYGE